jgi:hypothetical protein
MSIFELTFSKGPLELPSHSSWLAVLAICLGAAIRPDVLVIEPLHGLPLSYRVGPSTMGTPIDSRTDPWTTASIDRMQSVCIKPRDSLIPFCVVQDCGRVPCFSLAALA